MGPDVQRTGAKYATVELVGPHLRVSGEISLANFGRLSDMINHSRGYIRLKDARLLRRNGEPTDLIVPELMVNQDEVTFVGQSAEAASPAPAASGSEMDRPLMSRVPRQVVIFTEGHTLTGTIHAFAETDISQFVDSPDPRFVALVDVTASGSCGAGQVACHTCGCQNSTPTASGTTSTSRSGDSSIEPG
jgi:hypothetical protein